MDTGPSADRSPTSRRQFLAAMVGAFLWPGMGQCTPGTLSESRRLFGSPADVMIRSTTSDPAEVDRTMERVLADLERLNREWNAWKPGTLVTLNQALRKGRSHPVEPDLLALIRLARALEIRSSGLFNAGIGGVVSAWGFHDDVMRPGVSPDPKQLAPWRWKRPSLSQLSIEADRVSASNRWLQLDLGAIAKGWAIDRALDQVVQQGQAHAVVNLGGNLATLGSAQGRAWQIGIRDPLDGGVMAQVATREREAVVTSGSYERFRMLDGQRRSHIIDPRSAAPAEGLLSVTVLHRSAALADAASTALMVAGPRLWPFVADRLRVRQVLVVHSDGRGAVTADLAERLQFNDPLWTSRLSVVA